MPKRSQESPVSSESPSAKHPRTDDEPLVIAGESVRPSGPAGSFSEDEFGPFVPVPRCYNPEGVQVPPEDWETNISFLATWNLDFGGEAQTVGVHNQKAADLDEVAWFVAGINHVRLAVLGSSVVELVLIMWKPCWVPLDMVKLTPQLKTQVQAQKKKFKARKLQSKRDRRRNITSIVYRVLASWILDDPTRFRARQINEYADVLVDGLRDRTEVVLADFLPSFEHCSCLLGCDDLWKELYIRRVEAGNAYLRRRGPCEVMSKFVKKAEELLKTL